MQEAGDSEIELAQRGRAGQLYEGRVTRRTLPRVKRAAGIEGVLQMTHILRREIDLREVRAHPPDRLPGFGDRPVGDAHRPVERVDQQLVRRLVATEQV